MEVKKRWRFRIEDENDDSYYLDDAGTTKDGDEDWIGTQTEAWSEGDRRADLWENATGGWATRIITESRGKI